MKKKSKNNTCATCQSCRQVYAGFCKLWAQRKYYCTQREEMIDQADSCEHWQRKRPQYALSLQRFDEVERDLLFLLECAEKWENS